MTALQRLTALGWAKNQTHSEELVALPDTTGAAAGGIDMEPKQVAG